MCAIKNLKRLKAEPIEYFKKKFDNMTKRIWMSLTVIVVWSISSLYFLSSSSDGETAQSFRTFIHSSTPAKRTLSVPKTRSSVWKPPPPPPRIKKRKRDTSQSLYVKMQNQDIFGRCDLGDEPVDFSQAETLCERDPLCKAFVEIDGQAYLKSCVNPDKGSKGGRTLYVYHTYYKELRETPPTKTSNLRRKPLPKTDSTKNIYTSSSSSSQRPSIFQWKTNHPSITSPSSYSDVPAAHQWRYDSSKLFAPPSECRWPKEPPARPTESFEKLIREVCSKQSSKACELFKFTLVDAWDKALTWIKEDDTAYVITGDIPLMWLRDSVAQVTPYLYIANDPSIQRLMEGLLRRIMVWIDMDPYVVFEREVREYDCLSV